MEIDLKTIPSTYEWIRRNWLSFLVITAMLLGIYAAYTFIGSYVKPVAEEYAQNHISRMDFKTAVAAYTALEVILTKDLAAGNASRAGVFRFHDSVRDVSEMSYFFTSVANVMTKPGVTSDIKDLTNIPLITFQPVLAKILQKQPVLIPAMDLPTGGLKELLTSRGTTVAVYAPILDLNDNVVGLLFLEWLNADDQPADGLMQALFQHLEGDAARIGGYLSLQPDKDRRGKR